MTDTNPTQTEAAVEATTSASDETANTNTVDNDNNQGPEPSPPIEETKQNLEKALSHRPAASELRIDLNVNIAPALQAIAKQLQLQQRKDTVSKMLQNRPTAEETGVVEQNIAPVLQSAAKELEHNLRRSSLSHKLEARPSVDDLIAGNILKPFTKTLANSLQLDASMLEQALADKVVSSQYLKSLGIISRSYSENMNTVDESSISVDVASGLLLQAFVASKVSGGGRGAAGADSGVNTNVSNMLIPTIKKLEVQQKRDSISQHLKTRPTQDELKESGIIANMKNVAPSLQQTINGLGKELLKDSLSKVIRENRLRPRKHSFDGQQQLAPALQSIGKQLAMEQTKNALKSRLEARADPQELIDLSILRPYSRSLANSLQMDAHQLEMALAMRVSDAYLRDIGVLERERSADAVDRSQPNVDETSALLLRFLVSRPKTAAAVKYRKEQAIADALQPTANVLQKQQTRDALKRKIENRPLLQEIRTIMVADSTAVAPSLQQTIVQLGRELVKNALSQALRERLTAKQAGVNTQLAPALQGNAKQLEMAQKRDSLSHQMQQHRMHRMISDMDGNTDGDGNENDGNNNNEAMQMVDALLALMEK